MNGAKTLFRYNSLAAFKSYFFHYLLVFPEFLLDEETTQQMIWSHTVQKPHKSLKFLKLIKCNFAKMVFF